MKARRLAVHRSETEKERRINRLITQTVYQRSAGSSVDDSDLEEHHPHLMPELGERLRTLRGVEAAARRAPQQPQFGEDLEPYEPVADGDLSPLLPELNRYKILERLRQGGQGVVYRAMQLSTGRAVALKVLREGPFASERQRERFERETHITSRLQHPNIVTLFDSGELRDRPYYVMEYIDGQVINDYVLLENLTTPEIVRLVIKVVRAVHYAHQHGVIHRDLKPSNILVDSNGHPHILDFGLAKDVQSEDMSAISFTGHVPGTLRYMSPEQARGENDEVDVRSDIYSLGVVLYVLLADSLPYSDVGDPVKLQSSIREADVVPLRKALNESGSSHVVNHDLEVIIAKALSKTTHRRYQSAESFADDLDRYLAGDAVEAKADSRLYLFRKTLRRYWIHATVAAAFLIVLTTSSIVATMMWLRASAAADRAQQIARLTHATLNDVVTQYDDAIRPLAGGMSVRNELLDQIGVKLGELGSLVESEASLEIVQAVTHEKQGDIARAQGKLDEAARHYQAFLDISRRKALAEPADLSYRVLLARAYGGLGGVSDDYATYYERAIETASEVVRQDEGAPKPRFLLCKMLRDYGYRLYKSGHFDLAADRLSAAASHAETLTAMQFPQGQLDELLAEIYLWFGTSKVKLADGAAGVTLLERSLQLRETLIERQPANVELRSKLQATYVQIGDLQRDMGRPEQALALYEKAMAIGKYLTYVDPGVASWKKELYLSQDRVIRLLIRSGRLDEAQRQCDETLALLDEMASAHPNDATWAEYLAYAYVLRGRILYAQEEWHQACDSFAEGIRTYELALTKDPANLAIRANLATSHDRVSACLAKLGRHVESLAGYKRAYQIRRSLLRDHPDIIQRSLDVIASEVNIASWHIRQTAAEHDEKAEKLLHKARESLETLHCDGRLTTSTGSYAQYVAAIEKNLGIVTSRRDGQGVESATVGLHTSELETP